MSSRAMKMVRNLSAYDRPVWYDPRGITNILSISNVMKTYKVIFHSTNGNKFIINLLNYNT